VQKFSLKLHQALLCTVRFAHSNHVMVMGRECRL
jgi:hypothetical protein